MEGSSAPGDVSASERFQADDARRAGRYVVQPQGYRAFVPAPLPPEPAVRLEGELQALLSQADQALGRLDGSIQTLPDPDLFVFMYVRKEAVLSSEIEGTQSSLQDVLAAEDRIRTPGQARDTGEVINYVTAMNYGLDRLETLPISTRLIREIHERLLHGVRGSQMRPGELRTSQNWIGPAGCTLHEATFVPPPHREVPNALGAWRPLSTVPATCRTWCRLGWCTRSSRPFIHFWTATAASAACSSRSSCASAASCCSRCSTSRTSSGGTAASTTNACRPSTTAATGKAGWRSFCAASPKSAPRPRQPSDAS